ncbi:MAG: alpha/beta fold hydrolase [Chloroflexota bacterium]
MRLIQKFVLSGVLLGALLSTLLTSPVPSIAASTATAALAPCKFDVGLGAAKYQIDAKCAVVPVPEDWSKPDGKKLDIHVTVLAATKSNKQAEPIFYFEGGPGASAITNFGQTFYAAYRSLRESYDVVLIDQRGTGSSSSLQCTEVTDQELADLSKAQDDKEGTAQFIERIKACLTRLSATTDPALYTSKVFADDTDAVRIALGYDKVNVYGSSYGTWLGQIYLGRHGDHIKAIVLDSVAGPWNFYLLDASKNAQASLDKVFALCKADSTCNQIYPDLPSKLKQVLDKLDKEPTKTFGLGTLTLKSYPVTMTRSRFLEVLRSALYLSANISVIPQMVVQAANGDFTLSAAQLTLEAELASQVSLGMYYSVHCSESLPFYTDALIERYKSDSFYGAGVDGDKELAETCKAWRSAELDPADVAPVKSDRPVLILGGALDPITAVAFGQETNQRLTHSTLVVFPYQAHVPLVGSKCAQNITKAFFDAPEKAIDTSCVANDVKPIFAGAYQVELAPYSDPDGAFSVNIPKGWIAQPNKATSPMTFFTSPDGVQLLGIGNFKNMSGAAAEKAAFDIIGKTYGAVDVQIAQSMLFITIVQHGLDRPDQAYIGALLIRSLGADTQVVWQAAPANILQAVLMPVAIPVFTSLVAR